MSKPWDVLRELIKPPLRSGTWKTVSSSPVSVHVEFWGTLLLLDIGNRQWSADECRQLAGFLTEAADQLEGK